MAPAVEVKSTGDTTFLVEQTQVEDSQSLSKRNSKSSMVNNTPAPAAAAPPPQRHVDKVENPPCPDPSVHRNTKLQEQASSAALYVTSPHKNSKDGVLDANNKLSSRSAAASLKYANPRDLPSYPVVGINTAGSAHSAANLANSNHKNFEHWKPDTSSNAGAAAMAAKDYKMAPMWKPELSAAGSKAALLAHKDGGKLDLWMPQPSAEGNSAAGLAMKNKTLSPQLDYGYTDDGHKRALVAATGALGRSQSTKTPVAKSPAYPDSANSAHNALNAATVAHRPSTKQTRDTKEDSNRISSDAMRAARIQNYGQNVPREMFGGTPPVDIEVEEKKKQAALRASAISMAKQMYNQSEKRRKDEEAAEISERLGTSAATFSHSRPAPTSAAAPDLKQQAMQYIHLQEAAQKLASERLAKMDPDGVARYRAHYGYEPQIPRSRLSLKGRPGRRRAESNPVQDADDSSDDDLRSRRIRSQMNKFNESVADIDNKKQQTDRAALLAAAEKKVRAQMTSMDDKVFQDTGKVTPAMMEEWEAKARARATADSDVRQKNYGKVNIGGGKYMDQSELDAIAQSRLQPTLNEISETAEKMRARDEEIRLDQEERKRQQMSEREKEKDVKTQTKRLRSEEKAQAKAARKMEKDAEKARKAEEKQARKEEKRRSKDAKKEAADAAVVSAAAHKETQEHVPTPIATETTDTTGDRAVGNASTTAIMEPSITEAPTDGAATDKSIHFETADTDGLARIETGGTMHSTRSGLRPELDRHVSTVHTSSSSSSASESLSDSDDDSEPGNNRPVSASAVSPTSPTSAVSPASPTSASSSKPGRFSGIFSRFGKKSSKPVTETSEVPTASQPKASHESVSSNRNSVSSFRRHQADLHSISSLSSDDVGVRGRASGVSSPDEDEFEEARDTFDEGLAPPPTFGGQAKSESPARETKFQEEL